ncbi:MAG: hypothetical protein ABI885_29600 [Gammaproteobacteria bacterium]
MVQKSTAITKPQSLEQLFIEVLKLRRLVILSEASKIDPGPAGFVFGNVPVDDYQGEARSHQHRQEFHAQEPGGLLFKF